MNATVQAELRLVESPDCGRQLYLFRVQILTGELRQPVDLILKCIVEALVAIAKTGRGVPHLKVEVWDTLPIIKVVPLGAFEKLRRIQIVYGVAPRAVLAFELKQFLIVGRVRY